MRRSDQTNRIARATITLSGVAAILGMIVRIPAANAAIQDPAAPPPPPPATTFPARPQGRALSEVLSLMNRALENGPTGKSAPVLIADSTVAAYTSALPTTPTTTDSVEAQLTAIVKTLPPGTFWGKIYLPEPANHRPYDGDSLTEFAAAQTKLFGPFGGSTANGTVELLGQKLTGEKAQAALQALGLRPYYLISNSNGKTGFGLNANPSQWQSMTPAQKQEYIANQAQSLMSMDPASRNALMQQNFMIFTSFMKQLSPEDQKGVFDGMMGPNSNVTIHMKADGQ